MNTITKYPELICEILKFLDGKSVLKLYAKSVYFNKIMKMSYNQINVDFYVDDMKFPYEKLHEKYFTVVFDQNIYGQLNKRHDKIILSDPIITDNSIFDFKYIDFDYTKMHSYELFIKHCPEKLVQNFITDETAIEPHCILLLRDKHNLNISKNIMVKYILLYDCTNIIFNIHVQHHYVLNDCENITIMKKSKVYH